MKAIGFPSEPSEFDFPDDMVELKHRLKNTNIAINVSDSTLEILWYTFSDDYSALPSYWLKVDDETFAGFCKWLSRFNIN